MTTTREKLLDVAADLFYTQGFQSVGIDQIYGQVGITKTAFYKHFESKDDLIIAVLNRRDQRELEEWGNYIRIRGRDDSRRQLSAFFELLEEWFSKPDFRGCFFLNALTEFPNENDPINRAARAHGEHLASMMLRFAAAAGADDPAALTQQLMLLITGAISSRHRTGDLGAAKTATRVAHVLIETHCGRAALTAR